MTLGDRAAREGGSARLVPPEDEPLAPIGVPLVDLLDRVLATGVVIGGDIVLAIAEVPLVRISLHALLSSVGGRVASPFGDIPGCGGERGPW